MLLDMIESRKECALRKIILALISIVVLTLCLASPALADPGDEHRSNNNYNHMGTGTGQGDQVQNQNQEQVNIGN